MIYVGIDVHKKFSVLTASRKNGKILDCSRIEHGKEIGKAPWKEYFKSFREPLSVALEATEFWSPVYEAIEPLVQKVKLGHPLKTRIIAEARVKTDKVDSEILAHLLRADLLPTAYIPPREIRDGRELLRYRARLVSLQTGVKNMIQSVLHKCGYLYSKSDVFGKAGRAWIEKLPLREIYRKEVQGYLRLLDSLKGEIKATTRRIHRELELTPQAQLLLTIHGIGKYLALLIAMEIGEIGRFSSPAKLVS